MLIFFDCFWRCIVILGLFRVRLIINLLIILIFVIGLLLMYVLL